MNVPFYRHVRQYHRVKREIDKNIQTVLESGQYVMGPMLKRFESELAAYHGTKYAVGLGNGTDAIWLALMALGTVLHFGQLQNCPGRGSRWISASPGDA